MKTIILLAIIALVSAKSLEKIPAYRVVRHSLKVPEKKETQEDFFPPTESRDGRIANGYSASDGMFPWVARLFITVASKTSLCTGSLISSNYVITAKHCIDK